MDVLFDVSQITGNASDDIKRIIADRGPGGFFQSQRIGRSSTIFGESMLKRMKVVEISLNRNTEEEKKMEARVVIELDVTEGQYISKCLLKSVTYCVCVRHVERKRRYSWRVFCIPCRCVSSLIISPYTNHVTYLLTNFI